MKISKPSADRPYIGRFAPSPTGPLHFGSLIAALASYLDARHHQGKWLLRIDDIDHQRCKAKYSSAILKCLERLGLHWDDSVVYQQSRQQLYQQALEQLDAQQLTYRCTCSRKTLPAGPYPGTCRQRPASTGEARFAIRLLTVDNDLALKDLLQGDYQQNLLRQVGDFVLYRADQMFSYHLATVVDDAAVGVNHIIRGSDLLDSTPRQIYLQHKLQLPIPSYGHIPVAVNANGEKLSKQHRAAAVDDGHAAATLLEALDFLNQRYDSQLQQASPEQILTSAAEHWDRERIPKTMAIEYDANHK